MPTQRFEGKRVEERVGEGKGEGERESTRMRERKRERESTHPAGERQREGDLAPPFICFFSPPGSALRKLGSARRAVCST